MAGPVGSAVVRLLAPSLALLVLAAHFLRGGPAALVVLCVGLVILLYVRRPWVPRIAVIALLAGCAEWLRTLVLLAGVRIDAGQPWGRLAFILVAVAALTALSSLVFRSAPVRGWYSGR